MRPSWWWRLSATAPLPEEANASPTPAMTKAWRASPRRSRLVPRRSQGDWTKRGFKPCCRRGRRAMRSTARCGTSKPKSQDEARLSVPVLRRSAPSRPPSPSRSPRLKRWRPARARRRAILCSSSNLAAMATRRGSPPSATPCPMCGSSPMPMRRGTLLHSSTFSLRRRRQASSSSSSPYPPLPTQPCSTLPALSRSAPTSRCMTAPRSATSPSATMR